MIKKIVGKKIIDIYLVGFVDIEDGIAQFYPDYRWMYFEIENLLIEFGTETEFGRLKIREVDEVKYLFEVDEDMYKARTSIIENILISSFLEGNKIERVEYGDMVEKEGSIQCSYAKFYLKNNQIIFLDPTFPFGISIGGKEQEEYWKYCN